MSSNFSKKCLKHTDRQNFQLVEDSRSTYGSLENGPLQHETKLPHFDCFSKSVVCESKKVNCSKIKYETADTN